MIAMDEQSGLAQATSHAAAGSSPPDASKVRRQGPCIPSSDIRCATVAVNGIELHYAHAGTGPLVVFLHGFPQFHYAFRSQLREFSADHLAVAPDQRGYNLSSKPEGVHSYGIWPAVEDLRASSSTSVTTASCSSATTGAASWHGHLRSIIPRCFGR